MSKFSGGTGISAILLVGTVIKSTSLHNFQTLKDWSIDDATETMRLVVLSCFGLRYFRAFQN